MAFQGSGMKPGDEGTAVIISASPTPRSHRSIHTDCSTAVRTSKYDPVSAAESLHSTWGSDRLGLAAACDFTGLPSR